MKNHRIPFSQIPLFAAVALAIPQVSIADEKADQIVRKADEARAPQVPYSATVQVDDKLGGESKKSVFRLAAKGVHYSLVDQTAPARSVGRKLLMRDYDLWLYTPTISRPTRISFDQRLTGEVANGDIMRTNFKEDYSATIVGEEAVSGVPATKLHLLAKSKEVTYRTIDYWVSKKDFHPLKAVFFALSGKPLKTALYLAFKPVLGTPRVTQVLITDALQNGHTSTLTFSDYKKENFEDAYFSKEALGQ